MSKTRRDSSISELEERLKEATLANQKFRKQLLEKDSELQVNEWDNSSKIAIEWTIVLIADVSKEDRWSNCIEYARSDGQTDSSETRKYNGEKRR